MAKRKTKRIYNCVPSRNTGEDWLFEHATGVGIARSASIPPSKDLRATWWEINDQRNTGSCVGWASADGVLRWHFVRNRSITKRQKLSVRFQWMASKETDEFTDRATTFIEDAGTSPKAALQIAKKYGVVLDSELPFDGSLSMLTEQAFYAKAARRRISAYYSLTAGNTLNNFRKWIAQNGPILTRLECDQTWDSVRRDGKLVSYNAASADGGHAVALVGYTEDYFIVRNSWGTSWGDKGFAYASNAYTEAAFSEAYGVSP